MSELLGWTWTEWDETTENHVRTALEHPQFHEEGVNKKTFMTTKTVHVLLRTVTFAWIVKISKETDIFRGESCYYQEAPKLSTW